MYIPLFILSLPVLSVLSVCFRLKGCNSVARRCFQRWNSKSIPIQWFNIIPEGPLCCSLPARLIYIWNELALSPPFMPINRPTMSFKRSPWFVCTRSTCFAIEPLLFPQSPCYLSLDTSRVQTTFGTSTYLEHGVGLRVLSSPNFVHYPSSYVFCEQRVIWSS